MKLWAICDTDGGRHAPRPLARRIYTTRELAQQAQVFNGFAPEYYPVLPVRVVVTDDGDLRAVIPGDPPETGGL